MNRKDFLGNILKGVGLAVIAPVIPSLIPPSTKEGAYWDYPYGTLEQQADRKKWTFAIKKELENRGYACILHHPRSSINGQERLARNRLIRFIRWFDGADFSSTVSNVVDMLIQDGKLNYTTTLHLVGINLMPQIHYTSEELIPFKQFNIHYIPTPKPNV